MAAKTAAKATGPIRNLRSLALAPRPPKGAAPEAFVPGLGNVDIGIVDVGSWPGPVEFTVTGVGFGAPTPFLILVHPRQNQFTDNRNNEFPDQFATQVINASFGDITILITRIDPDNEGEGWGQDLELDIFVVE
jgi:hypothetical protein